MITMFRGALAGVIYEKTLGLPIDVRNDSAAITLMSTDVDSIATAFETVHDIWANTIEVSLAVYLLEAQLGIACVVPVALAVASTLCSLRLSKFMGPTRRIWNAAVQKRVGVTSSALGNMKGLKLMGMTDIVSSDIQNLRSKELDLSKDYRKLVVWINCISNFPHMISPFLTFLVFTAVSGNRKPLTAANAFTSLAIIGLLTEPLSILLGCIPLFFSSLSSFDRIQEYITQDQRRQNLDTSSNLQEAELQSQFETVQMSTFRERRGLPISTDPLVTMERAHFGTKADDQAILRDITLQIRPAKFTMIIGPVASGKSTLLKSILGELKPLQGELSPPSVPIAYCDQEPWLINDTLRKNITGPDIFDDTWYNTVIHACVLEHDFHQLPQGDMTRIGSKGVSLSGGQRNRVALARALYAKNELVVLDSVTAGLDNNSEEVVFSRVLGSEGILRKSGTTTVFATHAVHRAKHADWIIMLGAGGTIVDQGNYKDLSTRHTILQNTAQITKISDQTETKALKNETPDGKSQVKEVSTTQQDIEDLSRRTGDLAVYKYYFNSVGYPLSISFLTVSCASTFFMFFPQVWLQWWSDYDSKHPGQKKGLYLGVYGILSFTNLVLFGASIWYMFVLVTPRSAKRLHWILLQTVMKAPYTLMVKIDTGIILNRFSQDMSLIDIKLPQAAILTVYGLLNCIAATIIIATTAKWISIIIPPGCVIVWFIQKFYLRTSRQLRFLDLESKSPLYTHFSETLGGLASIRAYGWTRSFSQRNLEVLDASQRPYYLLFCLQSWLNLVMDIFVAVVAIVLVACAVGMKSTSGGMIGLALVSVLMFNQHLAELIHAWTNLETSLGAIARVKNFATTTVVEDFGLNKSVPPDNWPMEGRVCIENVASSYGSDATSVLQDINIELKGGQKIGICGRSGSGKSSLILTLYRLLETTSGSIHIDGLNLTTLSREAIRSKLIAIPQETFIRPGTIRCNIDPQSLSSTEAIITALTKTGLWTPVSSNGGLESDMDALSLSPGQRQLFCLATAILRKGKVLVLDEATSSVDGETEEVMQRLIEEEFRDSTVITVAHRLETIMTCDLIAVMDRGRIVEYGTPRELLQRKDIFWNLYNSQH